MARKKAHSPRARKRLGAKKNLGKKILRIKKPARKIPRLNAKTSKKALKAGKPAKKTKLKTSRPQPIKQVLEIRQPIGKVTHYFTDLNVAVIELNENLRKGDKISIEGATTRFSQKVESMQVDRNPVKEAVPGDSVGLKVKNRVREGDSVFRA